MSSLIGADAAKLAGLQIDLLQKLRSGGISLEMLEKFVRGELVSFASPVHLDWGKVYQILGLAAEYNAVGPTVTNPALWTVPVIQGVTCNKVVAALRELGVVVSLYVNDLDKDVLVNDRDPKNGSYVVSFRANVEANEENKNQSANQRKQQGCKDITLLERLLLEVAYFMANQQHLDVENWTLCAGSRYSDGSVPDVHWYSDDRQVYIDWYYPDSSNGRLRARSVVS